MQLKPVSLDVIAEAREEAQAVMATLVARLAPGEHVVRLGVDMEGQEQPLSATVAFTVEGDGGADDLVGAEVKYLDNFVFLLTCGLAQTLCSGVLYLRSQEAGQVTVQAWHLCWGALHECPASETAELLGGREPGVYLDAFSLHDAGNSGEDDEGEAVYPPVAYTIL